MKLWYFLTPVFLFLSCGEEECAGCDPSSIEKWNEVGAEEPIEPLIEDSVAILVLGNVQDGGSPHAGCEKVCCKDLFVNPNPQRMVVSLGLIDPLNEERYLFEATPDLPRQLYFLENSTNYGFDQPPNGIFLTHAHIGHYAGLMHLGREAMNASGVPVYAMPKMKMFLEENGPWDQLVSLNNIVLSEMQNETSVTLNENLQVTPFLVPHRDEYSETVGFKITGPNKSALFIPDIDKWSKWNKNIIEEIQHVDYAFIDATFYDENELTNRNMYEIPHPFVIESMELFKDLNETEKQKVIFIHLNHTNPLLDENSAATNEVISNGFQIARKGDVFYL